MSLAVINSKVKVETGRQKGYFLVIHFDESLRRWLVTARKSQHADRSDQGTCSCKVISLLANEDLDLWPFEFLVLGLFRLIFTWTEFQSSPFEARFIQLTQLSCMLNFWLVLVPNEEVILVMLQCVTELGIAFVAKVLSVLQLLV